VLQTVPPSVGHCVPQAKIGAQINHPCPSFQGGTGHGGSRAVRKADENDISSLHWGRLDGNQIQTGSGRIDIYQRPASVGFGGGKGNISGWVTRQELYKLKASVPGSSKDACLYHSMLHW
jgi:hypothetical protein